MKSRGVFIFLIAAIVTLAVAVMALTIVLATDEGEDRERSAAWRAASPP